MAFPLNALAGASAAVGGSAGAGLSVAVDRLTQEITKLNGSVGQLGTARPDMLGGKAQAVGGAGGGGFDVMGLAGLGGISTVTSALSSVSGIATSVTSSFQSLLNPISQLVQLIDPGLVQELHRQFSLLSGTIGTALRPIIEVAVGVIHSFSSNIAGAMQQLAPVIAKVASAIGDYLAAAFDNLGTVLEALTPVLDVFADVVAGVAAIYTDFAKALRPVIEVVTSLGKQLLGAVFGEDIGGKVKGLFVQIRDAIQSVIKTVMLGIGAFLKLIGATDTLNALMRGLEPRKVQEPMETAKNAAIMGVEELGRKLTQQAFQASAYAGGEKKKDTADLAQDILKEMRAITAGDFAALPKTIVDIAKSAAAAAKWLDDTYKWLTRPIGDAYSADQENSEINARGRANREAGRTPQWRGDQGRSGGFWDNIWDT